MQIATSHPKDAFSRILAAVKQREPFSFIRLGDGEGRVMGYPNHVSVIDMSDIWKTWFGHSFFADSQIRFLQEELRKATLAADVIGLPDAEPDPNAEWGRPEAIGVRDNYFSAESMFCNCGVHLYFQSEDLYPEMLNGLTSVSVVGPRDIRGKIKQLFGAPEVLWAKTPPEMRYSMLSEDEKIREIILRPHFTELYHQVMTYGIPGVTTPGQIVLVGAGVLGKLYCRRVQELGGVAIDVGSMMDFWDGLQTRASDVFKGLTQPLT